jgi:hypothetical protein
MSPENWLKIEEIFQSALDLSPAERRPFIEKSCRGDFLLQSEVEKLVADYDSAENFIESPVWTDSIFSIQKLNAKLFPRLKNRHRTKKKSDPLIGRRIGVYKLKNKSGAAEWARFIWLNALTANLTSVSPSNLLNAEWTRILLSAAFATNARFS